MIMIAIFIRVIRIIMLLLTFYYINLPFKLSKKRSYLHIIDGKGYGANIVVIYNREGKGLKLLLYAHKGHCKHLHLLN
jgi:hypothetical protein